jgi:hypothetical protein
MVRKKCFKPVYPLHARSGVAAKRGLVLQMGPPSLVADEFVGYGRLLALSGSGLMK